MIAPSSRNTSNLKSKRFMERGCRLSAIGGRATLTAYGTCSQRIRTFHTQAAPDAPPAPNRKRHRKHHPENRSVKNRVDHEAQGKRLERKLHSSRGGKGPLLRQRKRVVQ